VKTTLEAGLADTVLVYDHPAEQIGLPAVVFVPAGEWWQPKLIGASLTDGNMRVDFELHIILPRSTELETVFAELEALAVAVAIASTDLPILRFLSLSRPEPIEVNGAPALMARMAFTTTV